MINCALSFWRTAISAAIKAHLHTLLGQDAATINHIVDMSKVPDGRLMMGTVKIHDICHTFKLYDRSPRAVYCQPWS